MTLYQNSAPRSSHGCLYGCLGALAIIVLPFLLISAYGAWFLYQGFRNDPVLRAVGELVRQDGMAQTVLGKDIQVTGVQGNAFSFAPGLGTHSSYSVTLEGSKTHGTLAVEADNNGGRVRVESMILTGPDGTRYDLMHHAIQPSGHSTTEI